MFVVAELLELFNELVFFLFQPQPQILLALVLLHNGLELGEDQELGGLFFLKLELLLIGKGDVSDMLGAIVTDVAEVVQVQDDP